MTCNINLLVVRQGFDPFYVDSKCLVASQNLVQGLHQLLLLRSHISLLFIEKQDHQTILVLTHRYAAVSHCLANNAQIKHSYQSIKPSKHSAGLCAVP